MNKDTIIGIVGAVVLIAAMVGVFKYEGSQGASSIGGNQWDVTWATAAENGPSTSGSTPLGEESEDAVNVTRANLTEAEFTLAWTPGQGSSDTLRLTVTPPSGSGLDAQSVEGDGGELALTFAVPNDVPEDQTFFANSEDEARERVAAQHTKRLGTGEWTVTVAFVSAEGVSPVPGVPDPTADEEVAWELNTILHAYAPTLTSAE